MSDDIIERVARVIDPDAFHRADGHGEGECPYCDEDRDGARNLARAVIAAMREPDEAMIRSARLAMIRDDLQPTESEIGAGWRAAIDAALSEKESG